MWEIRILLVTRILLISTCPPDIQALAEVVVTGYSVDERRETTGSVSVVEPADLTAVPSGNVEQQLQGRVAGVTVITNGQPGTTSQVRIRGYGALGGNQPLYIVDGVPVQSTDFLSPDDIETTTVLKDATAAAIYGARAAGGVIVYTTRQGKKNAGHMKVTYNGMVGVTTPGPADNKLSPALQAEWTWNAIRNAATNAGTTPDFNHPQYGTGQTPVVPDWLLVGPDAGIVGPIDEKPQGKITMWILMQGLFIKYSEPIRLVLIGTMPLLKLLYYKDITLVFMVVERITDTTSE